MVKVSELQFLLVKFVVHDLTDQKPCRSNFKMAVSIHSIQNIAQKFHEIERTFYPGVCGEIFRCSHRSDMAHVRGATDHRTHSLNRVMLFGLLT